MSYIPSKLDSPCRNPTWGKLMCPLGEIVYDACWQTRWDISVQQPEVTQESSNNASKGNTTYTIIIKEIRKVVICQWIRVGEPSFIFGLGTNSTLSIGTAWTAIRIPFFATKSWISEQVVRVIAFRCHPILVISPSDTVQFIDQVRKPTHTMACLGAGIRCCISWYIWPLIRVRWKREWGMWIFALLQTSRGTGKMSLAAFRWRAVDLELVKLMHFWFAIASCLVRKPRAIPSWPTASPGIRIDCILAGQITLIIIIETNANSTVTAALGNFKR